MYCTIRSVEVFIKKRFTTDRSIELKTSCVIIPNNLDSKETARSRVATAFNSHNGLPFGIFFHYFIVGDVIFKVLAQNVFYSNRKKVFKLLLLSKEYV
jgi:hypothetical protein